MWEVKNNIDWEEVKKIYNDDLDFDIFYDGQDYNRIFKFDKTDDVLGIYLDQMFGGDWFYLTNQRFKELETYYIQLKDDNDALTESSVFNKIITQKEAIEYFNDNNERLSCRDLLRTIFYNNAVEHMCYISTNLGLSGIQLDKTYGGDWIPLSDISSPGILNEILGINNPKIQYNPDDVKFNSELIDKGSLFSNASPHALKTTNANGASESHTDLRFDLIPPEELATIAKILGEGAIKYGEYNWKGITTESNLNHAIQHIYAYLSGDRSDDHLGHAATRMMFAMWTSKNYRQ